MKKKKIKQATKKPIKLKKEKIINKKKPVKKDNLNLIQGNLFDIDTERNRFLFYAPRILSIIFILCIIIFSMDIFGKSFSLFSLILILVLIFSWKRELVGAIGFILFGLWYILLIKNLAIPEYIAISGSSIIIGIMFLLDWFMKKR